jgi:hypothetical protein
MPPDRPFRRARVWALTNSVGRTSSAIASKPKRRLEQTVRRARRLSLILVMLLVAWALP